MPASFLLDGGGTTVGVEVGTAVGVSVGTAVGT